MQEKLISRSVKRTQKQVAKAAIRRDSLLEKEKLSLPSGQGVLSIIVSRAPDHKTTMSPGEQYEGFIQEAERIEDERAAEHQEVRVRPMAVLSDVKMEFADPEVTDIVMIGHGSIGTLWMDDHTNLGWRELSRATSHLKQGAVEQRMCGNFPLEYNVPLATFAVATLGNLKAAPNMVVPNLDPEDGLFVPIYNDVDGVRHQIELLNSKYTDVAPVVIDPAQG